MSKRRKKKAVLIRILWAVFILILFLVSAAELMLHRHVIFGIEGTPLFEVFFGFGSCVAIVLISKLLGFLVKKPEDYYIQERK